MKTILIFIAISLLDPNSPSVFAHKSFNSLEECETAARVILMKEAVKKDETVKIAAFCIDAKDLAEEK